MNTKTLVVIAIIVVVVILIAVALVIEPSNYILFLIGMILSVALVLAMLSFLFRAGLNNQLTHIIPPPLTSPLTT